MLPAWTGALETLRRLAQDGVTPDIARLSDPQETTVSLAMSRSGRLVTAGLAGYLRLRRVHGGCLLITGYEGSADDVAHRRAVVRRALRDGGAVGLGQTAGRSWEHTRFAAPALRDTLLDAGAIAETLETAATWTDLDGVYRAVRGALGDSLGRAVIGCHISHLYRAGASLYFTVLAAAGDDDVGRWGRAKQAANDAIVGSGGTITHHHAVGTAHRDHVAHDLGGAIGVTALRAVKAALDPSGILTPGKLLPEAVTEP
jgi:alkyldihydroxyacetonephosphate synthase